MTDIQALVNELVSKLKKRLVTLLRFFGLKINKLCGSVGFSYIIIALCFLMNYLAGELRVQTKPLC